METDDDFIDCKCPYCGGPVSFPEDCAGGVEKCPNCTEDLVVPADGSEMAGRIPLPITTPRLVLRRLAAADWKDLVEFHSDEELFQYEDNGPVGEKEVLAWLDADRYVKLTTPNTAFCLAIQLQPEGKVMGNVYLHSTDGFQSQADVRICVSRKCQRQGFATEALKAILNFCFDGIGLHRVSTWCDSRNIAACRVAEKTGMRREGELIKARYMNAEWVSTVLYAILNEEYGPANAAAVSSVR
jgi:RimJ/RimL family protein N-acetyltransferase